MVRGLHSFVTDFFYRMQNSSMMGVQNFQLAFSLTVMTNGLLELGI